MLTLDFVQSIGWALSAYNLGQDSLLPGLACSVQGFFINVGDVGSSVWSLAIAIHTVLLLAGGQHTRAWAAKRSTSGKGRWILCISIWMANIFLGLIGPTLVQRLHYDDKGPFCNFFLRPS
jgi:G protein-coupled glucose receptor regulating Gpa2